MKITEWPQEPGVGSGSGSGSVISSMVSKLKQKKRFDLISMVEAFLKDVEQSTDLDHLFRTERAARLKHCKEPVQEFRIPPRKAGGVVRIYFCFVEGGRQGIYLLDWQLKKGEQGAKIQSSIKRYKQEFK